ncbi:putative reverse transcriptase domain-containing protein [Tanacetum coccineum]
MEFLNRSSKTSKDGDNELIGKGLLLGDLAGKIRNIDGKILGKDGKPMVARRCVSVAQPLTYDLNKCMVSEEGKRPDLGRNSTTVNDQSSHSNDASSGQCKSSAVCLPLEAIDDIKARFANSLVGFPVGKRLSFLLVENYVKFAWAKYGLKRVMMHHGFFMFQFDSYSSMVKVMEDGPWRIKLVPMILKFFMPNSPLMKEKVTHVPLWVKMHNVPIVAFSKVGLDLISAKVGRLLRLDAHTNFICLNSWGRSDYARALVEVSADKPLVESVDIDIPSEDGEGHTTVNIRIEFEWKPPRCGETLDTTTKPSPSDSSKGGTSFSNDDISLAELRTFVDKSMQEESVLEYVGLNDIKGCTSRGKLDEKGFKVVNLDRQWSSSGGGGHKLEEDAYDDYEVQFEDYTYLFQEFCDQFDFKVKGLGRK